MTVNNQRGLFVAIISATILLSGCLTPRSSIEDLSSINKDTEVVLIGRIEIVPKIQKEEVSVKMAIGGDELYRTFILRINEDIGEMTDYMTDKDNMVVVKTEEDFYITSNRNEPFKFFGGWFYTKLHGGGGVSRSVALYHLINGMKADFPKNAGAVYLGTVRFKRDEFFNLKAIDFAQDDFDAAQKRFQKKFKTNMPLVKAKISQATTSQFKK